MKKFVFFLIVAVAFASCSSDKAGESNNNVSSNDHSGIINEVIQTSNYTYVLVKENESTVWAAVPRTEDFAAGDSCYYTGGMEMVDFESKELNKTFDKVMFLQGIRKEKSAAVVAQNPHGASDKMAAHGAAKVDKQTINIDKPTGAISIAELFEKRESYQGQKVTIRGQVAKFNAEIMKLNWIHVQDGTEFDGKFDLTVTTQAFVSPGDTITLEGTVALNRDFGYGYSYEILLEEAIVK